MWIHDVDVPQALIEAYRASELVMFVGTGASLDPPSNLTDSAALMPYIAGKAQMDSPTRICCSRIGC